jgi:hypothetical protein
MRYMLIAVLAATGCFSPNLPDCLMVCGARGACGDGQTCSNGFCTSGPVCGEPDAYPSQPDASPSQPDASPSQPDASPSQPDAQATDSQSATADATAIPNDAGWTWDGQYNVTYTSAGCSLPSYLWLLGVDNDGWGTDQWYANAAYTTLLWTGAVHVTGPNALHFDAFDMNPGWANAWDATRTADGLLTGTMTTSGGCSYVITLTRQ